MVDHYIPQQLSSHIMEKRYSLIVLLSFFTFITSAQKVKIKYFLYSYTTINYSPSSLDNNDRDSAIEEELISQIDTSDIVGDYRTEQTIIYPQIYGMKNKCLQDSLNSKFRFELEYSSGNEIIHTLYVDSGLSPNFTVDSSKIKTIRRFNSKHFPDEYSAFYTCTTLFLTDDRFLSICTREEEEGNQAAHPNFSEDNGTIDLTDGGIVCLETLFKGNYLDEIRRLMKETRLEEDDTSSWNKSMCTPKQDWINRINPTTGVAKITTNSITLKADTRDFGCPEVARDIMTIDIPLIKLDKYKKK